MLILMILILSLVVQNELIRCLFEYLIYTLLLLFKTSFNFLVELIEKLLLFYLKIIACLIFSLMISYFCLFILILLIIFQFFIYWLLACVIYSFCLFKVLKKLKFKFSFTWAINKIRNIVRSSPTWWRTTNLRCFFSSLILYFRNLFWKCLTLFKLTCSLTILLIVHWPS